MFRPLLVLAPILLLVAACNESSGSRVQDDTRGAGIRPDAEAPRTDVAQDDLDGVTEDGDGSDAAPDATAPDASESCQAAGESCQLDGECCSTLCNRDGAATGQCAQSCVSELDCAFGERCDALSSGAQVCIPAVTCTACTSTADCEGRGTVCTDIGEGERCLIGCSADLDCPVAFECQPVRPGASFCVPEAGGCSGCIDADGDGYGIGDACVALDCDDTNRAISPAAAEVCDAIDNNCDGAVDEGLERNACGGCLVLPASPGDVCESCGTWQCDDKGELACTGGDSSLVNACGGCTELGAEPGTACGTCGLWVCSEDQSSLECADAGLGEDLGCGTCATGTVACDDGVAQCVGDLGEAALNACGGCAILAEEPGTPCGECSTAVYECGPDRNAVQCSEPDGAGARNACGGCDVLDAAPGDACGECGDGMVVCDDLDRVTCSGDAGPNACGGCSALSGVAGQACGTCGTGAWACDGVEALVCEGSLGEAAYNVCGGCGTLAEWASEGGGCDADADFLASVAVLSDDLIAESCRFVVTNQANVIDDGGRAWTIASDRRCDGSDNRMLALSYDAEALRWDSRVLLELPYTPASTPLKSGLRSIAALQRWEGTHDVVYRWAGPPTQAFDSYPPDHFGHLVLDGALNVDSNTQRVFNSAEVHAEEGVGSTVHRNPGHHLLMPDPQAPGGMVALAATSAWFSDIYHAIAVPYEPASGWGSPEIVARDVVGAIDNASIDGLASVELLDGRVVTLWHSQADDVVRARWLSASGWSDVVFEASTGFPTRPGPNAAVWQSAIVGVDGTLTSWLSITLAEEARTFEMTFEPATNRWSISEVLELSGRVVRPSLFVAPNGEVVAALTEQAGDDAVLLLMDPVTREARVISTVANESVDGVVATTVGADGMVGLVWSTMRSDEQASVRGVAVRACVCDTRPWPSCDDGVQNGDETDTDCGGSCTTCGAPGSASARIGPEGGGLRLETGDPLVPEVWLVIPEGALAETTEIGISVESAENGPWDATPDETYLTVRLSPEGTEFALPIELHARQSVADVEAATGLPPAFRFWSTRDETEAQPVWVELDTIPVRNGAELVTRLDHFSLYRVMGTVIRDPAGRALNVASGCDASRPPVLLVHGLAGSASTFGDLYRSSSPLLPNQTTYRLLYNSARRIDRVAGDLAEAVGRLHACHGSSRGVSLVGHSMGGLVARSYLQDQADEPVAGCDGAIDWVTNCAFQRRTAAYAGDVYRYVSLDTPHAGSILADFVVAVAVAAGVGGSVPRSIIELTATWQSELVAGERQPLPVLRVRSSMPSAPDYMAVIATGMPAAVVPRRSGSLFEILSLSGTRVVEFEVPLGHLSVVGLATGVADITSTSHATYRRLCRFLGACRDSSVAESGAECTTPQTCDVLGDRFASCDEDYDGLPNCLDADCNSVFRGCSGNGVCSAGRCACETGWTGTACDTCAAGYVGPNCDPEPTCTDECSFSGTGCIGSGTESTCSDVDGDGCTELTTRSCPGVQTCSGSSCRCPSQGRCSSASGNECSSASDQQYTCSSRDGCIVETSVSSCGGQGCSGDRCRSCIPNSSLRCDGNDVYNFDSCGVRGSRAARCSGGERCVDDGTPACECVDRDSSACFNGDVYWFDSCGDPTSRRQRCSNGCSGGSCSSAPVEVCNGRDDDGNGLIDDDIPSCWLGVYEYMNAAGNRCWGNGGRVTGPPPACAGYAYRHVAWIQPSSPVSGGRAMHQCSRGNQHILVPFGSDNYNTLLSGGSDCSLILGYPWDPGTAPEGSQLEWGSVCPIWRFYDTASAAHVFTQRGDSFGTLVCEPPYRFEAASEFPCFSGIPSGC